MAQASGHVPAWKRLGLKLKYAKEEVLDSDSPPVNRPHTAKSDETNGISKPKPKSKSKKSDLNGHSSPPAPTSNGSVAPTLNGHRDDGPPPAKKQKRVSFSPDTKLLDGDGEGASTARHAVVPSELANGGPSSSSSTVNTDRTSSINNTTNNKNKNKPDTATASSSKPKPAKKPKTTQTPPSKHKSQNMLDYLHLYYNNHANWKFQKNREVWILKHALSTEAIGTKEYGLALAQYVYGLKGEAARKRLAEEAEAKLIQEMEEMEEEEKKKKTQSKGEEEEEKEKEEAEQLKKLKGMLTTAFPRSNDQAAQQQTNNVLAALSRPLLILAALYPDRDSYRPARRETPPAQNGDSSSKRTAAETAKSKKKKNRTVVVEYSSSSESESESESETSSDSDSDSSSDSSSESDGDNGQNDNDDDDDETSSSGEDSSSSDDSS